MQFTLPPFRFKGNRNYLHGTDILNATLTQLSKHHGSISNIDFSFHRMSSFQLVALTQEELDAADPVAICRYQTEGDTKFVYLVETDAPVVDHYLYPEDEIADHLILDYNSKSIMLDSLLPYSNIELWVAMTKVLHYRLYADKPGKWLFVRGRLPDFSRTPLFKECSVSLSANFGGKLTRCKVRQDGTNCGEIFFSLS